MDDDLYQNAWSETTNTIPATLKDDPVPSWTSTKLTSSYGEEADLAAPSWSTGAGIHWNEPSSPGFTWGQAEPDMAWGTSVYEGIPLGKTPTKEVPVEELPLPEHLTAEGPDTDGTRDEELPPPIEDVHVPSPATTPLPLPETASSESIEKLPEPATPPSPDGFGSFETGLPEETVHSPGFALNDADADPWGASAWSSAPAEEPDEPVDEWERARQEKAKQDRRVPPELLAHILSQCEELSRDLYPDVDKETSGTDEASWRNDWRGGLEGVPGLPQLLETFLPPLALKAPVRFPQTSVAKKMATSVKLTKNLPLTKGSPMSHYLAAKGSTAWEVSVKEQKEVVTDDIPVGWRIVEKTPAPSASDSGTQKKPTGRLFSFWGRRQSQIAPQSTGSGSVDSRASSVDKPRSPVVDEVKSESRRPSQDSVRSSMTGSQAQVSPSGTESPAQQSVPAAFATTVAPTAPAMTSYSSAPDPLPDRSGSPPAPSAMSRFLNRFSRRGSAISGSPRSSLALSSDDLEFLSDIVPSASDDADEDPTDALEKFVNQQRGPDVSALPPPLAPPPKAPAIKPVSAASGPPSAESRRNDSAGDFGGLMGSLDSFNLSLEKASPAPPSTIGAQPVVPALPPPLVPSRPITPSATSVAGPSRVSLPQASTSRIASSSRPPSRLQTSTPPLSGFGLPPPPSFHRPAPLTMPSKPKLSSPFPLPMPPASQASEREPTSASTTSSRTSFETAVESSPTSPTSSLPLGELYPHLVTPASPPLASSQPMLSQSTNGSSSPSGLSTPMASAFSPLPPANPLSVSLAPPPSSGPVTSPTNVPLTSNLFDDDDFSDFQSPVESSLKPSPPIPPPIAKSPRTLAAAAAKPTTTRSQTAAPKPSPFTFPGPPPPAAPARASSAAATSNLASFDDDDDFADFQASPSSATALKSNSLSSSTSSLFPTGLSDQALLTPKKGSGFDDMGDFFSSTLRTPSPPRVPAKAPAAAAAVSKPTPGQIQIPPPPPPSSSASLPTMSSASSSSSLLSRRKPHAAEHLHTLSLVEKAAARQGQWPAPASPLPAAIPGPFSGPSGSNSKQSLVNLMDDETPLPGAGLAPSLSSPAMLNPSRPSSGMAGGGGSGATNGTSMATSNSASLLQGWDFQSSGGGASQPLPPKPTNGAQPGGLSAQDLSFFEGL
ncbi:hypothetical protein C8Q77DRAFT_315572 [Trametes polyzona]|nr:hypothetical protein C8Q77DRAFT_315572 [Trametes polyzona]